MDTLILEDFRCFAGRNEIPIRPLTLLVGENSTGKTSFLAAVRAGYDLRSGATPDFNEEPFSLGSYDQIANYRRGRATSFAVGQQFTVDRRRRHRPARREMRGEEITTEARFTSTKSQPTISDFFASSSEHKIQLTDVESDEAEISFSIRGQVVLRRNAGEAYWTRSPRLLESAWFLLNSSRAGAHGVDSPTISDEEEERFRMLIDSALLHLEPRPYAFAPIRTSPRRTYDPTKEIRDPEGSHIPVMLERLLGNGTPSDFRERIEEFGIASGLYSSLRVRKLGRKGSDPFQIEVRPAAGGRARNLVDVGYGVSQAIPIIADCASAEPYSTLLIQQPEVHLHPRAQAAMGSFFAQLADSERNQLVVETHSDYLIDRVRMDVRDERIKGSDVVILYFEQAKGGVKIHPIEIDAAGNITGVPADYRRFFLDEQRRFLGVD